VLQRIVRRPSDARAVGMAAVAAGMRRLAVMVVIRDEEGVEMGVVASGVTVRDDARSGHGRGHHERREHEGDDGDTAEHRKRSYHKSTARQHDPGRHRAACGCAGAAFSVS